jgi:NADH-quinone oxidoreductase subunit L
MTAPVLTLLCPLAGAAVLALAGRHLARRAAEVVAVAAVLAGFIAACAAWAGFDGQSRILHLASWFSVGHLAPSFSLKLDALSLLMALMVSGVSTLIHVYSVAYMRRDQGFVRYFCYLNLFVFSMQTIVMADDLVFLFLGWEGVGFCSFALIGFWSEDAANVAAGRKAFILTRIGDVAYLVALALIVTSLASTSLTELNARAGLLAPGMVTLLGLLFLFAACGKSAQLPLLVWLPDAMAAPTPVSALIHAATMVTAGVYLLMRLAPMISLSPAAMLAIAAIGALTAFFAACAALAQHDVKRVLAWSTVSQVGYMFLGLGAGDLTGSFFHLLVHAFFKSLLFLGAGCMITAMHEDHDIFRMGARLRRHAPGVFAAMVMGACALGGVPPAGGFFSKGRILFAAFTAPGLAERLLWVLATAAALLTVLYAFRLVFVAFFGQPAEQGGPEALAPVPKLMVAMLWPLALLALAGGALNLPGEAPWSGWLGHVLAGVPGVAALPEDNEALVSALDALISLASLLLAWRLWGPKNLMDWRRPAALAPRVHTFFLSGWKLDALYLAAVARPYQALALWLWRDVDGRGLDGLALGAANLAGNASRSLRRLATGRVTATLVMFALGLALILLIFSVRAA